MSTINDSDHVWTELPPNRRDSDETDVQLRDIRRRLDDLEVQLKLRPSQSPTGRATQGPPGAPGAAGAPGHPGMSTLPNMIYLWHKNGMPVEFMTPDSAGLTSALVLAVGGDTVWIPSITIPINSLTVVIPPGVILRGMSRQGSILSFTNTATAIIMSNLSRLRDMRIVVDGTGVPNVVGVDNTQQDTKMDGVDVVISGGSSSNRGSLIGVAPIAIEKWLSTGDALYWSPDYFSASVPTFNKITGLPVTPAWFGISRDGTAAYIARAGAGGVGIYDRIYVSLNPRAVTPTWTLIAQVGDALGWTTIGNNFGYVLGPAVIEQNLLITAACGTSGGWAYGEYNGASWAWSNLGFGAGFKVDGVGLDTWQTNNDFSNPSTYNKSAALLEAFANNSVGFEYLHHTGGPRYCLNHHVSGNGEYVHQIGVGDLQLLGTTLSPEVRTTKIRGSLPGPHVYVVYGLNGHLWISNDGTTFTDIATWGQGWADDNAFTGGGLIDWTLKTIPPTGTAMRLYNRDGSVNSDKTGNLQALIGVSGDRNTVGVGLVFP